MDILLQEIVRHRFSASVLEGESMRLILEVLNVKDLQELYLKIGQDLISPQAVLYYMEGQRPDEARRQEAAQGRNTLTVRGLDKAVFKFARCCNPLPGQDHVLATLSERGVTFHHRDCHDLLERHSLLMQQMLRVHWDWGINWRHPLVIDIRIVDIGIAQMLEVLSEMRQNVLILQISAGLDRHNRKCVSLSVNFHNFSEAREFFSRMPAEKTMVEDFGREQKRKEMPIH
jgi:GTP pyrophosphokinase